MACGNSIGVGASPAASCPNDAGSPQTTHEDSSVNAPVTSPVAVTGNSVAVLPTTDDNTTTGTTAPSGSTGTTRSDGNANDVQAPVAAPVNACGNSIGIGASPAASCPSTAAPQDRSGSGTGTDANAPVTAPVAVCGNNIGVLGAGSGGCPGVVTEAAGGSATEPVVDNPVNPITEVGSGPNPTGLVGTLLTGAGEGATNLASTGSDIVKALGLAAALVMVGSGLLGTALMRSGPGSE
jgi:hypothetical protein